MKKLLFSLLFLLFILPNLFSQCPSTEIVLTTQQQIDDFAINYPNCTQINDDLVIKGSSDIQNLNGLIDITLIEGDLIIGENSIGTTTSLINLNGLESLVTINGDLIIQRNNQIQSLLGLNNLIEIGGVFKLNSNQELLSLDGLSVLNSVHGLFITLNNKLNSIEALSNLNVIESNPYNNAFLISRNDSLTSLEGLDSVHTIDGSAVISDNGLLNLYGLRNLKRVNGYLSIESSEFLLNLNGLENLERIAGRFRIAFNTAMLNLEGLDNLKRVEGELEIHQNALINLNGCKIEHVEKLNIFNSNHLIDLTGLEGLTSINGDVIIKFNDALVNLMGLNNLKSIGGEFIIYLNKSLVDLQGLEALEEVSPLAAMPFEIKYNDNLQTLRGLNSLKTVGNDLYIAYNNELTQLNTLQNLEYVGEIFTVAGNDKLINIDGLEKITTLNIMSIIGNDSLVHIEGLKNLTSVNNLSISYNLSLETLNALSNLNAVNGLVINTNSSLLNLEGLEGLDSIGGSLSITNNENLENLVGLDNLEFIEGNFNLNNNIKLESVNTLSKLNKVDAKLSIDANDSLLTLEGFKALNSINGELIITENGSLESLSGIQNIHNESITKLTIKNNINLSLCETINVCNYLTSNAEYIIENNSEGCNSSEEIIALCGDEFNTITGQILYDINDNGCDVDDIHVKNTLVYTSNDLTSYSTITDDAGVYVLYVEEGSFTTTAFVNDEYFEIFPQEYTSNFENLIRDETVDFCLTEKQIARDIAVTLIPLKEARAGFDISYELIYENLGTSIEEGSIILEYENSQLSYINASVYEDSQSTGLLTWGFQDLLPFEQKSITVNFNIFTPPTVNNGDILTLTASTGISFEDFDLDNNTFELQQTIIGSYDPNDKTVLEGNEVFIEQADKYLHYIINFQNIGTASAINVRIEDIIDDKLDRKTFQILTSSHEGLITSLKDNKITFLFEDINLNYKDDNEEESKGFVVFRIKPEKEVNVGDIILGQASIFFDFNQPIITNTVSTTFIEQALSITEESIQNMRLFPSPSNSKISIQYEGLILQFKIYNTAGKLCLENSDNKGIESIDIKKLSQGIYFIKLMDQSQMETVLRFVKN